MEAEYPALLAAVELSYLFCYPLVPALLVVVLLAGGTVDVDRFWTAVLIGGYGSYGSLPWLISRPPRLAVNAAETPQAIAAVNVFVLGRVSHELNTFPSGHVSVSWAAALTVLPVSPAAAAIVGLIAAGVSVGAAAGRYHYIVDVLLGVAAGGLAAAVAWWSH